MKEEEEDNRKEASGGAVRRKIRGVIAAVAAVKTRAAVLVKTAEEGPSFSLRRYRMVRQYLKTSAHQ